MNNENNFQNSMRAVTINCESTLWGLILLYTYNIFRCFVSLPGGQILNVNALNHWPMPRARRVLNMLSCYASVGVHVSHLIGQNDRAVCKRHGLSWRCIRKAQSTLRSWAGPDTERKPYMSL